eukprot:4104025-Amphidinium_carterae.2
MLQKARKLEPSDVQPVTGSRRKSVGSSILMSALPAGGSGKIELSPLGAALYEVVGGVGLVRELLEICCTVVVTSQEL